MHKSQQYLEENYPDKETKEINISGWIDEASENGKRWIWKEKENWTPLTDDLDLSQYHNLEKLNCSYNQITSINLAHCSKLIELECWGNKIAEINLPKHIKLKTLHAWNNNLTQISWRSFDAESLTSLSISNNDLKEQDLSVLEQFINLEELYLGTDILDRLEKRRCNRFSGSLKSLLEKCNKLKKLQIEETGIEENAKFLPKELKVISWHKQNDTIARIIPSERLYVIRNKMNQFLKKWGEWETYSWYELKKNKKETKLGRLESPKDFNKRWWLVKSIQWTNRATSVVGGSLLLVGSSDPDNPNSKQYTQAGGLIAITSPFVETLTSYIDNKIYQNKQQKWDEFLNDANDFLNNYNELLGILSQFKKSSKLKGRVNKAIEELREKASNFLNSYDGAYDEEQDGEIDINELLIKRDELIKDLEKGSNSEVRGIANDIKKLEEAVIDYRRFSYYESVSDNSKKEESYKQLENQIIDLRILGRNINNN